jgi:glutaredoxin
VRLGPPPSWLCALALGAAFAALAAGCSKPPDEQGTDAPAELPPLTFRADTPNLMLTWIDPRGGTHVEATPDKVPEAARDFVRVVISDSSEGTTDPIYVSDLNKQDAGTYTAKSTSRRAWEDEIERRRSSHTEVAGQETDPRADPRAPRMPPADRPPRPTPDPADDPKPSDANTHVRATVYGAEWCGPCHQALAHLKKRGVKAAFKDIEKDRVAQAEMQLKLSKVGKPDGRIPVIEIDGKILVGYSRGALDAAIDQAVGGTAL